MNENLVRHLIAAVTVAVLVAVGPACTRQGDEASRVAAARVSPTVELFPTASGSVLPTPGPSPSTARAPRELPARFRGTVSRIPKALAAAMRGTTWHPGCLVPLGDLRLLTLRYWGFDGRVHEGPMVINASVADDVVSAFRQIFRAHFPIKKIRLARRYRPGHDDPTDRSDFSAGFNCRPAVTARGPLSNWSQHAYGLAIDINPIQNPYVTSDGFIRNYHARRYRDRSQRLRGMIHPGDAVVRAFESIGWHWAGDWSTDKDYMHFSLSGN